MIRKLTLTCVALLCTAWTIYAQCDLPAPAGSDCTSATFFCNGEVDGFCSTLPPNPAPSGPSPLCNGVGIPNNTEWIAFAAGTANITFLITPSNCDTVDAGGVPNTGVQAGIYTDCGFGNAVTCQGNCQTGPFTLGGTFNIGQVYFIFLDGCGGSVCDYEIQVTSGSTVAPPPGLATTPIGQVSACPGANPAFNTFTIPLVQFANIYNWTITPPTVSFTQNGNSITITDWGGATSATICVEAANDCYPGSGQSCTTVNINPVIPVDPDPCFYCPEDLGCPYNGTLYNAAGSPYSITLTTFQGCDSTVTLFVEEYFVESGQVEATVCQGDCFVLDGVPYCTPLSGIEIPVSTPTVNGCDSSVFLQLEVLNPTVTITGPLVLDCQNSETILFANPGNSPNPGYPWSYQWSTPDGSVADGIFDQQILRVDGPGTYTVEVTLENFDGFSCSVISIPVTVTEDADPPLTMTSSTDAPCSGNPSGSVSVVASGGGGAPYDYQWDANAGNAMTQTVNNLPNGTYLVTVTSSNGCTALDSATISSTASVVLSVDDIVPVECNGDPTGSATVSGSGGTPNYDYAWSTVPVQNTPTASGLVAGTYTVTITDDAGCTDVETIVINEPPALASTATALPTGCNGDNSGTAYVTPGGGSPGYTYLWDSNAAGQMTDTAFNLTAGFYSVTITDANSCTQVINGIEITEPTDLTATSSVVNAPCNGDTGSATVSPNGGTPGYDYLWSSVPPQSTPTATNLPAGTYSVTVTDLNGCTEVVNGITIIEPDAMTGSAMVTDVTCNGDPTGSISITATGTGTLNYTWSPNAVGATGPTAPGLPADTYSVTVTDANGCTFEIPNIVVGEPTAVVASISTSDNIGCFGESTGSATAMGNGGNGTYTYQWGPNAGDAITQTVNSLPADTYSVTVTDGVGCTNVTSITLTEPSAPLDISLDNVVDASCTSNDGSIEITVSGGTPGAGYNYLWTPGNLMMEDPTGLAGGSYTVVVTDENGCTADFSTTVNIPGGLTASAAATDLDCFGDADADIDVTVSGGTGTLVYQWSEIGFGNVQDVGAVGPGTYTVTITDANNCSVQTSVTIPQPDSISINSVQIIPASCGLSDGSIDLFVTGGTGSYSYSWTGGADPVANPGNLAAGSYDVEIMDGNGCTKDTTITIISPDSPLLDAISATPVGCFGDSTGTINLEFTGGQAPYTYDWTGTDFDGQEDPINVYAGTYDVVVTDINNCSFTTSVVVNEPSALGGTTSQVDVACNGDASGSATALPTGGTSGYTYLWCDGQTTATATNLARGDCGVTITDANGCTFETSVTISEPPVLSAMVMAIQPADCNGNATGSIDLDVSGGAGGYSYNWSPAAPAVANPTGLAADTYAVTITDANGCIQTVNGIVVNEPSPISLTFSTVDPDCALDNGSISVTAAGGNGNYSYAWSGGAAPVFNPSGLAAGTYDLVITDNLGCTLDTMITLTTPAGPVIDDLSATDVACNGDSTGTINLSFTGGQAPYTLDWPGTDFDNLDNLSDVPAGVYEVTITDDNNCSAIASVTVDEPTALTATTATTDVLCNGEASGTATATPAGGTVGYTYLWCDGQTTATAINLPVGDCGVTITDANGCVIEEMALVNEPPALAAAVTTINPATCNGTATGSIELNVGGGVGGYTYQWSPAAPAVANPGSLAADTYSVTVTDANNCSQVISDIIVTEPAPITFNSTTQEATCNLSNGSIDLVVSGGNGNYSYVWTGGADPVSNPGNLAAGTYDVTITDMLGCTATGSVTVTTPTALAVQAIQATDANCFGEASGSIIVAISGGSPGYTYTWSGALPAVPNPSGLVAGTYDLTVTDTDGCTLTTSAIVGEPAEIIIDIVSVTAATCNQDNGSADISVTGGVGTYTYAWSNGSVLEDPSDLPAGIVDLVVTDAQGCTAATQVSVTEPGALNAIPSVNPVSCFSATDGSITINTTGGNGPYNYTWSVGGIGDTNIATNLGGGTYSVVVRDADGCLFPITSIVIPEPDLLVQNGITAEDASCLANDGSIDVNFIGGTPGYTYSWTSSTGPFTSGQQNISNLEPGDYQLVVTDLNGCSASVQGTIGVPTPPTATATPTAVRCFGESNGSINVVVNGANGAVIYNWDDGSIGDTPNPSGLPAGTYQVTVVDDEFCEAVAMVMVEEPPLLDAQTFSATAASCNGDSDGSAVVTVMGGTPGYTYLWSNGAMIPDPVDLPAGTYSVVITDANGCTDETSATITEPAVLVVDPTVSPTRCANENNGSIILLTSGGNGGYDYDWTDDQYDGLSDLSNLPAGTYTVVVSDGEGCSETIVSEVTAPPAVEITLEAISEYAGFNVSCANLADGSATVAGGGGNGQPFTYQWQDGTPTNTIEDLAAGDYGVTVTDALGCTEEEVVSLTAPEPIDLLAEGQSTSCFGDDDGSILIGDVQGGSAPYLYSIDGSPFGEGFFTGLTAGNYEIVVQDANGCEESAVVSVTEPNELVADLASVDGAAEIQLGDSLFLTTLIPGNAVIDTFYWTDGLEDLRCDTCRGQWVAPTYTTTYGIFVEDANGCIDVDQLEVRVKKDRLIYIPTGFAPGATGENRIFTIYGGTGVEVVESFVIADRWGEIVFSAQNFQPNDPDFGWDGRLQGEFLNPGVFVYFAKVRFTDGRVELYKGDVTLIR
ncbi:MAG: hypothetical protein AAFW73_13915 [Bacteroidota bacterium]